MELYYVRIKYNPKIINKYPPIAFNVIFSFRIIYENIIVIIGYNPTIIVKIFIFTLFCNAKTYRRFATYNENNAINANNGIYALYLNISFLNCLYLNIKTYNKLAMK
jgi:hypothetical protein